MIKNGFLLSEDVKVFPCAYRGYDAQQNVYNPEAKLNTEANFVSKGSNVSDLIKSYIIDWTDEKLTCVVAGYKFELKLKKAEVIDAFKDKDVYIKIKLDSKKILNTDDTKILSNINIVAGDLDNQLETSEVTKYFTGLQLVGCTTGTTDNLFKDGEEAYTLRILTADGNVETLNELPSIAKGKGQGSVILGTSLNNPETNNIGNLEALKERATGQYSLAANKSRAQGDYSAAFNLSETGDISDNSLGWGAAAFNYSIAHGNCSLSCGGYVNPKDPNDFSFTFAAGDSAFAGGYSALAAGISSFAFGGKEYYIAESGEIIDGYQDTEALGDYSFAFGRNAKAKADTAIAIGHYVQASGKNAVALGYKTTANSDSSFAIGNNVESHEINQIALGMFNQEDKDALLMIGNGSSERTRQNALTVKKDGKVVTGNGFENTGTITSTGNILTGGGVQAKFLAVHTDTSLPEALFNNELTILPGYISSGDNEILGCSGNQIFLGGNDTSVTIKSVAADCNIISNKIVNIGNVEIKSDDEDKKLTGGNLTVAGTITSTGDISTEANISTKNINLQGGTAEADGVKDFILINNHKLIHTTFDLKPFKSYINSWNGESVSGEKLMVLIPIIREKHAVDDYTYTIDFDWGKSFISSTDRGGYGTTAIGIVTKIESPGVPVIDSISTSYKTYAGGETHGRIFAGHLTIWLPKTALSGDVSLTNVEDGKVFGYVLRQNSISIKESDSSTKNIPTVECETVYGIIPASADNLVLAVDPSGGQWDKEILYTCTMSNLSKLGSYHNSTQGGGPYN